MRSKIILVDDLSQGLECVNQCIPKFMERGIQVAQNELVVLMLGLDENEIAKVNIGDMKLFPVSKEAHSLNGSSKTRTEQLNFQLLFGLRYGDPDLMIARCRDSLSEKLINHAVPSGHVVYLICDDGESIDELIMAAAKSTVPAEMERLMPFIDVIDKRKESA